MSDTECTYENLKSDHDNKTSKTVCISCKVDKDCKEGTICIGGYCQPDTFMNKWLTLSRAAQIGIMVSVCLAVLIIILLISYLFK